MIPAWLESVSSLNDEELQQWLQSQTPEELAQTDMEILQANPALWCPQPGPQTMAFHSEADELFYGGSQGGGKSDLLLGLAATQHYHSVIFRRTFPLHRSLIERSREILKPLRIEHRRDPYNESLHRWAMPDGRMIEFGAMEHEHDKENWRGRPHDLKAWDEVSQFTESQFRFANAWNRSTRPKQRCRIVATGNPPTTVEGEWVIRYWAPWLDSQHQNPAQPGELRWFIRVTDDKGDDRDVEVESGKSIHVGKEIILPRSRTFIPARLNDNPILEKTGYMRVIQALPEPLRSQAIYGDFTIGLKDDIWQAIPTAWVRAAQKRWTPDGDKSTPLSCLGVDPNYGGGDQLCIAPLHGRWFGPLKKYRGKQALPHMTGEGEANATLILREWKVGVPIIIDTIGWGAATYESLKRFECVNSSSHIRPVNVAAASNMYDRSGRLPLVNVRAALYWSMREALDPVHGDNLALPPDREVEADLCSARYQLTPSGIKIEKKEDIIERIGRSPDAGEAVLLAHWFRVRYSSVPDPVMTGRIEKEMAKYRQVRELPDESTTEESPIQDEPDGGYFSNPNWKRRGIFG